MYGLLIENVIEFIKFKYGDSTWLRIRDRSKITEYTFVTHKMYSEKVIPRLARAVHDVTGDSEEEFMRETGYDFVLFLGKYGYDKMLRVLGRSMRDFLNGLDNLHEYLRFSYPKMKPPSFFCTDETADGLTLHYRTKRKGYTHYVQGQLMRVGKMFYNLNVQVQILEEKNAGDGNYRVTFRLRFDNREFREAQARETSMSTDTATINMPSQIIFDLFPFHIRFDSEMTIRGIGGSLKAVMPDLLGKNLTEAFELKRPQVPFIWDSVRHHENCVFEMQSSDLVIRNLDTFIGLSEGKTPGESNDVVNGETKENGEDADAQEKTEGDILEDVFQPRRMRLKGQMRYVTSWKSYMFLATPALPNLDAMFETGLFINDLSMHDSSRDLVLAGTQQSAELKLALDQEMQKSKQLETSMRQLDLEMKRTDSLLYQMIPRQVADKLRRGEPATSTCEVFRDVTILFSDVVGFTSICSRITPMAVVSMLNAMYTLFDRLSEQYEVYKVETIGDAYMVVGGAPVKSKLHAVRVAEMALAMVQNIVELTDPSSGEAMAIRVGIHSGTVVAGVVGLKMPRYCLFGDTVNTASRMESNGKPQKIAMSETTKDYLDPYEGYILEERKNIEVKGKGKMKTYWLKMKMPGAPDHLGFHNQSDSGSENLSRCNSSDTNLTRRGGSSMSMMRHVDSRRASLISSIYTPVSFEEISRAGTPAQGGQDEGCPMSPIRMALDKLNAEQNGEKHIGTLRESRDEIRPVTPRNSEASNNNASSSSIKKDNLNFGQVNYSHGNMQSFMDPAYAHGKLEGAITPPYQMAKKQQHRLQQQDGMDISSPPSPPPIDSPPAEIPPPPPPYPRPHETTNNLGNNGSLPNRAQSPPNQLSPVRESPRQKRIIHEPPTRRVQTTDSSTNTSNDHVPHSSACQIL